MIGRDVFINCPFSADYQLSFQAIVFTIVRSGFKPRCARENDDGGEVRIDKICRIIRDCPYSVHDLSMTELDAASGLPRFNMPLELGTLSRRQDVRGSSAAVEESPHLR